mgnify:CR=1 FL=1
MSTLANDDISTVGDTLFQFRGLHEIVLEVAAACEPGIQETLLSNIVVHGGTAAIPGLSSRLQWELEMNAPRYNLHCPVQVTLNENPQLAAWRGACNLTTLDSFSSMFVSSSWSLNMPFLLLSLSKRENKTC